MQTICLNPTFCNHLVHNLVHIKCIFSGPIPSISDQDIQRGGGVVCFSACCMHMYSILVVLVTLYFTQPVCGALH